MWRKMYIRLGAKEQRMGIKWGEVAVYCGDKGWLILFQLFNLIKSVLLNNSNRDPHVQELAIGPNDMQCVIFSLGVTFIYVQAQ